MTIEEKPIGMMEDFKEYLRVLHTGSRLPWMLLSYFCVLMLLWGAL